MIVAIPTIGMAPQLPALVDRVYADGADHVVLMINRPEAVMGTLDVRAGRVSLPGWSIYAEWNWAITNYVDATVVLLNDDVELAPGALGAVVAALASEADLVAVGFDYQHLPAVQLRYCRGTYREHGIGGFAFAVKAARCPLVDEQFEWWGGDDDLMYSIERAGGLCAVLEGAHVTHVAETTAIHFPWTHEARARDRARFLAKWGTSW